MVLSEATDKTTLHLRVQPIKPAEHCSVEEKTEVVCGTRHREWVVSAVALQYTFLRSVFHYIDHFSTTLKVVVSIFRVGDAKPLQCAAVSYSWFLIHVCILALNAQK